MTLVTSIGAVSFALESTTRGRLPALRPRPLLVRDGVELQVVEEDGHAYLLVDYRQDVSAPARVEFWRPLHASEGSLAGLFMIADTAFPGPARDYERLGDLAGTAPA